MTSGRQKTKEIRPSQRYDNVLELPLDKRLDASIARARDALLEHQHPDGHWCLELEADCTIPAEYILMMHYMDEIDEELQSKIAVYLRARQYSDGGWSLYCEGDFDLSCTVKAYYALKFAGDSPREPHMRRAREAILERGGAACANVFTRYTLALFRQVPWRAVPFLPVEIMLLPSWFPFHFDKVSYWSRTVMIPLSILASLKPRAKNPKQVHVRELFVVPPEKETNYFPIRSHVNRAFLNFDRMGRYLEHLIPKMVRRRALRVAEKWIVERLNGTDGLGAIFPAMVNALEALTCLGYPANHRYRRDAKQALEKLLIIDDESAYCQPCVSPVWDTALAALTLLETEGGRPTDKIIKALDWLRDRQVLDLQGDWSRKRPQVRSGGWAFQYANPHYPDLDDTAVVAWAMQLADTERYKETIARAVEWIRGMQSQNGGFAAFDADNTNYYLNEIPFADHGALLDPPTSDVSARCVYLLACADGAEEGKDVLERCLRYLRSEQEPNGSWFGRWGTNYVYGTWSVLVALECAGISRHAPVVGRAVAFLKSLQRPDGGWGEGCCSYGDPDNPKQCASTSFQTAWALLGLMAAGEADSPEVQQGIEYLTRTQCDNGLWQDELFTAPGFPRVFYLKYYGYDKYFPLWALARYRTLRRKGSA